MAITLALTAGLWARAAARKPLQRASAESLWTLLLASVCLATAFAADGGPRRQLSCLVPYVAMALSSLFAGLSADEWRQVRRALLVVGALVAVTVVLDASGAWFAHLGRKFRPGGALANRNFAGEYLAIIIPIAIIAARRAGPALLPLLGFALTLTRCRGAWLAAAVAVAVVVLVDRGARGQRARSAALFFVGALAATVIPTTLSWRSESPYGDTLAHLVDWSTGSGALRIEQHLLSIPLLESSPWLGLGPGNWYGQMARQHHEIARNLIPHSDYLRVATDAGIPALLLLLVLLGLAATRAWRARMPDVLGAIIAVSIISAFGFPLFRFECIAIAIPIFGTALRSSEADHSSEEQRISMQTASRLHRIIPRPTGPAAATRRRAA